MSWEELGRIYTLGDRCKKRNGSGYMKAAI